MKKLFQFLKSLFVKLDILEDKVEKAVVDSKLLSEGQKKKIKENLDKFDKIEENVEDVVEKAEIAAEKVIDVVEHKKLESVGDAINSVKEVINEGKEVVEDVKEVADDLKKN